VVVAVIALATALVVLSVFLVLVMVRLDRLVQSQQAVPRALAEGQAAQAQSLADVREQLGRLGEAARGLQAVGEAVADVRRLLQVPKLRGTLGELWLEELLRQMLPESAFELQYGFRGGDRVDAVIRLRDRLVPIDAKFPLEACQRMLAAEGDEAVRERRAFTRTLRQRVDEIAHKYIRPDEGTYEFALMYIPAENVYYEAVIRDEDGDRGLVTYALDRKVIPVSPNTFYAYLSALVHGLRGLEVEERAREILGTLNALRQEFDKFDESYQLVGRHLANAEKQYLEAEKRASAIRGRLDGALGAPVPEERSDR